MQIRLRVQSGNHAGKEIDVTQTKFLIGRSESCHLRPKSESVSRRHCILAMHDGRLLLQDLKSRNGTYVNEKRLPADKAKVLKDGDLLRVGKLSFTVVIEQEAPEKSQPEAPTASATDTTSDDSSMSDSRFEEVDVSSWLDEADAIDRVRKMNDPETRQLQLNEADGTSDGSDSAELSVSDGVVTSKPDVSEDDSKFTRVIPPKSKKKGKLPEGMKQAMLDTSRDAADDALKRFFSGR